MAKGIKTGGRTKGAVNKATTEMRESFQKLVSNNLEQLDDDIKSLEPKDRLRIMIEFAKFLLPTLKQVDFENDNFQLNIPTLPDIEIRRINKILEERY